MHLNSSKFLYISREAVYFNFSSFYSLQFEYFLSIDPSIFVFFFFLFHISRIIFNLHTRQRASTFDLSESTMTGRVHVASRPLTHIRGPYGSRHGNIYWTYMRLNVHQTVLALGPGRHEGRHVTAWWGERESKDWESEIYQNYITSRRVNQSIKIRWIRTP